MKEENSPRIFQIGFNRCATTTLTNFLRMNGISAGHWRNGKIARSFYRDFAKNRKPFQNSPVFTAYTDMIHVDKNICLEAYKEFEYIFNYYPDSYYILNTRDRESWIKSRKQHKDFLNLYMSVLNTDSEAEVLDHWRSDWDSHHEKVLSFFENRTDARFIIYDIDKNSAGDLVNFLEDSFPHINSEHYAHFNKSKPVRSKRKRHHSESPRQLTYGGLKRLVGRILKTS
jgi:hypothetical protein